MTLPTKPTAGASWTTWGDAVDTDLRAATTDIATKARQVKSGVYVPDDWGQHWDAAVAGGHAVVGGLGDSITQGFYGSNLDTKGWLGLLQAALQTAHGDGGSGLKTATYTSLYLSTLATAYSSNMIALTGSWVAHGSGNIKDGPGAGCAVSLTEASTATRTVRGTIVKVVYLTDPTLPGGFTITIDGGTPVSVSSTQATAIRTHTISGLSTGNHTVVITVSNSSTIGIYGIAGENATGVTVNNFGHTGYKADDFADSGTYGNAFAWSGGQSYPSDLLFIGFGANEAAAAQTADVFMSNLRLAMKQIKEAGSKNGAVDVCFLLTPPGTVESGSVYHGYAAGLRTLAETYGAAFIDMWTLTRNNRAYALSVNYYGTDTNTGAAGTSAIHPGDAGHQLIYDAIAENLPALGLS